MTEQPPPSASKEALNLATRIRDRYHAPGNEHVLELDDAAIEIDRFAERVCEQVSAETERCAAMVERIADPEDDSPEGNAAAEAFNAGPRRDMTQRLVSWSAEVAKAIRAPAERPAPPQQPIIAERSNTDPQQTTAAAPSSAEIKAAKDWYWHHGEGNRPREDEFFVHLARYAAAAPPSPPAVVDYTERADAVANELVKAGLIPDRGGLFIPIRAKIAAGIAAVASEHQAALEAAEARLQYQEGHREPCYYCGKPCNSLAGNPGEWPVALCHADDPGKVKYHHADCVTDRLDEKAALLAKLQEPEMREALRESMMSLYGWQPETGHLNTEAADEMADAALAVITEKLT